MRCGAEHATFADEVFACSEGFDSKAYSRYRIDLQIGLTEQGGTMTVSRRTNEVTSDSSAERRAWVKPGVQRLSAGSAETGSTQMTDIGVTYS